MYISLCCNLLELFVICPIHQKLVNETFQTMWFVPKRDKDADKLLTRVMNITDVVAACRETGYDWFEQLLENVSVHREYHLTHILHSL